MLYVDLLQHVTAELPPLLDESDLHIAQWTLVILRSIAEVHPNALQDIRGNILPQVMTLVKSPLLQGGFVCFDDDDYVDDFDMQEPF